MNFLNDNAKHLVTSLNERNKDVSFSTIVLHEINVKKANQETTNVAVALTNMEMFTPPHEIVIEKITITFSSKLKEK